jgi:hypothetical protein
MGEIQCMYACRDLWDSIRVGKKINPLDAMGISLNKQEMMYKVLATSIILKPYKLLWAYGLCVHGWLSVKQG